MKRLAGFVFVFLLFVIPYAQARDSFVVGAWTGYSYYDSGKFTHCAMSAEYQSGDLLLFSINRNGDLVVSVANPTWKLPVGAQTRILISIDRFPPISATAENLDTDLAAATFSDAGDLFYELRRGYVMRIDAGGNTLVYNLTGTYRALQRLLSCTAGELGVASIAGQAGNGPFGSSNGNSTPTASANAGAEVIETSELLVLASNILSDAGITGYRILSAKEAEKFPGYPVVWVGPGQQTFGALTGLRLTDRSLSLADAVSTIGAMTLSGDASSCAGEYASGIKDETSNAGIITKKLFTACRTKNSADTVLVQYVIFGLPNNEVVKLGVVTVGDDQSGTDQLNSTSERLVNAAVYTLSNPN